MIRTQPSARLLPNTATEQERQLLPVEFKGQPVMLPSAPTSKRPIVVKPSLIAPKSIVRGCLRIDMQLECVGAKKPLDCVHTVCGSWPVSETVQLSIQLDGALGSGQARLKAIGCKLKQVDSQDSLLLMLKVDAGSEFQLELRVSLPSSVPNGSLLNSKCQLGGQCAANRQLLVDKQAPCKRHTKAHV